MRQPLYAVCGSILLVAVSSEAQGQCGSITGTVKTELKPQVAGVAQTPEERPEGFLGLDVFGDWSVFGNEEFQAQGFDIGAALTPARWAGISGAFGRSHFEDVTIYHVLAGPQFYIGNPLARWDIHALVGFARTTGTVPSQTSVELILGGGLEFFVFRFGFDYVRLNLDGVPKNSSRAFVGVVVPFCFRSCRETDGLNVSGRPATK